MANQYWDYDALARKDANGQLLILTGYNAINNALRNYFRSFKGEYIRKPTKGGLLTSLITKPLSDIRAKEIRSVLRNDLTYGFTPALKISTITVTPIYEYNYYDIYIEGYAPIVKQEFEYSDKLKNLSA